MNINTLNENCIASLQKQLAEGYNKDQKLTDAICSAMKLGKIRVFAVQDNDASESDFSDHLDTCTPSQKAKFRERIEDEGIWTIEAHYWNGREWEDMLGMTCNTISTMVGMDFCGSGYELQIMEEALEAYNKQDLDADGFVIDPYKNLAA